MTDPYNRLQEQLDATLSLVREQGEDPDIYTPATIRFWILKGKSPEWIVSTILLPPDPR